MTKQEKITELLNLLSEELNRKALSELEQISTEDFSDSFAYLLEESCRPLESYLFYCCYETGSFFEIDETLTYLNIFGKITKEEMRNPSFEFWKKWLFENDIDIKSLTTIIDFLKKRKDRYWSQINQKIEKEKIDNNSEEYGQLVILKKTSF